MSEKCRIEYFEEVYEGNWQLHFPGKGHETFRDQELATEVARRWDAHESLVAVAREVVSWKGDGHAEACYTDAQKDAIAALKLLEG